MENKEKLLEEIKQAEQHLINLKEALNKPDTVEVAADGAILVEGKKGYFVRGDGKVNNDTFSIENADVKQLSTYVKREQAQDEVLRREISCYIRRRACELNDNHDWRKVFDKNQYRILIERSCSKPTPIFCVDYNLSFFHFCAYFSKKEHAQTVADELNAKYSPETIKRLYYAEEK